MAPSPVRCRLRHLVVAAIAALVLAACGGDDGESASRSASASGSATGSATGAQEATCSPVSKDLEAEATETVDIELTDYAFAPASVEVGAGVVTFAARNAGGENHELAFLPGGGEVPLNAEGEPDEDALADAGAFELEAFGPGQSCNATYDLQPGTYTLLCIVTSPDGETHLDKGMRGALVVS